MAGASHRPRRVDGVDPAGLPVGPNELTVLSLVDGARSVDDLVRQSALPAEVVDEALEMLAWIGAIEAAEVVPVAVEEPPPAAAETVAAAPVDAAAVEIDGARRQVIDDAFAGLETKNHYELLGVSMTAEKREVKEAYFRLIPVFHPDKYFGKRLGAYKPKLDKIFEKLTRAHDVLTRKQSRAEYDDYLGLTEATEHRPSPAADSLLQKYLAEVEAEARVRAESPAPPPPASPPPPPPPRAPASPDARRRALARKLAGNRPAAAPVATVREPTAEEQERRAAARDRAGEELRRLHRFRAGGSFNQAQRVGAYVRRAEELADSNPVAASEMLQKAQQLAPDDGELQRSLHVAEQRAAASMADTFLRRARYEEQQGEWARAAESYSRVVAGLPDDPVALERCAFCMLKAGKDLRKAVELAKRAVLAAPSLPVARATAARAYLAAGMKKSAVGEAKRAVELDPSDKTLAALLQTIERA